MSFSTTHNLAFEAAPYGPSLTGRLKDIIDSLFQQAGETIFDRFKVGTCVGLWRGTDTTYDILSIVNEEPGNGHLEDVFEWFEHSCLRDGRDLRVLHCHERFWKYLIEKRGFQSINVEDVIKIFKQTI